MFYWQNKWTWLGDHNAIVEQMSFDLSFGQRDRDTSRRWTLYCRWPIIATRTPVHCMSRHCKKRFHS